MKHKDDEYPRYDSYTHARAAARETLDMYDELQRLRVEVEELREYQRKYIELLDSSIEHNKSMVVGLLGVAVRMDTLEAQAK